MTAAHTAAATASATVAVFGFLRFAPGRVGELLPSLRTLVEQTRLHDGCIAYDVSQDAFDPGVIRFSELWPDQATLDRHMQAPHIEPWRNAARACGVLERRFTAYDVGPGRAF